jgi:hypothetical protein
MMDQGSASVFDHMGIRRSIQLTAGRIFPQRLDDVMVADVAIAVPERPTLGQTHTMHHAVTDEPVVSIMIDPAKGIGAVPQVTAVQSA